MAAAKIRPYDQRLALYVGACATEAQDDSAHGVTHRACYGTGLLVWPAWNPFLCDFFPWAVQVEVALALGAESPTRPKWRGRH